MAAVSGGADSCALAAVLYDLSKREKLKQTIIFAHFNHNLRGAESAADENFVRKLAAQFDFEIVVGKWISPANKNIEAAARQARYDFLAKAARKAQSNLILTAHTVNDQAETFLLNLLRGSGSEGLGAMKPKRPIDVESEISANVPDKKLEKIFLIRPLLNWACRADTEDFCRFKRLIFAET